MSDVKLFVATKAIIEKDGKVLILREQSYDDGTNEGKYSLVGGRIDPSESLDQGFEREVFEEAGLNVVRGRTVGTQEWWPEVRGEQWHIVAIFFACTLADENQEVALGDEHDEYKWIDPKHYKEEGIIENLYPMFEAYLNS